MPIHTIGTIEDFKKGQGTRLVIEGIPIAVFNLDGEFYAIADNCPHKNLPLHKAGHDRYVSEELSKSTELDVLGSVNGDRCSVNCPWHQWEWDLESGTNLRPGTRDRIPVFDVTVEGEEVRIEL